MLIRSGEASINYINLITEKKNSTSVTQLQWWLIIETHLESYTKNKSKYWKYSKMKKIYILFVNFILITCISYDKIGSSLIKPISRLLIIFIHSVHARDEKRQDINFISVFPNLFSAQTHLSTSKFMISLFLWKISLFTLKHICGLPFFLNSNIRLIQSEKFYH